MLAVPTFEAFKVWLALPADDRPPDERFGSSREDRFPRSLRIDASRAVELRPDSEMVERSPEERLLATAEAHEGEGGGIVERRGPLEADCTAASISPCHLCVVGGGVGWGVSGGMGSGGEGRGEGRGGGKGGEEREAGRKGRGGGDGREGRGRGTHRIEWEPRVPFWWMMQRMEVGVLQGHLTSKSA